MKCATDAVTLKVAIGRSNSAHFVWRLVIPMRCCTSWIVRTVAVLAVLLGACGLQAGASATLLIEEPYGKLGFFTATGHVAVYLSGVCAQATTLNRMVMLYALPLLLFGSTVTIPRSQLPADVLPIGQGTMCSLVVAYGCSFS
jgi:hypothetical protein